MILENNRIDGRKNLDFRKTYIKTDVIKTAKGSAYLEQGNTKIMCAVFGPKEILTTSVANLSNLKTLSNKKKSQSVIKSTKGILICKVTLAPFCQKLKAQNIISDDQQKTITKTDLEFHNRYYSECLSEALESTINLLQYPKSQIEICVYVLEDDGSLLSSIINCASLAIITSGIEVFDVLSSSTLSLVPATSTNHSVLLDPNKKEEAFCESSQNSSKTIIGYLPSLSQTSFVYHFGQVSTDLYNELINTSIMTATAFADHIKEYLTSWATAKQQVLRHLKIKDNINETL